jgi:predicted kinase
MSAPRHVVVMGVTATGKTTVGIALAEALGGVFVEGDAFHPQAKDVGRDPARRRPPPRASGKMSP